MDNLGLGKALIVREEKRTILDNGADNRATELVPLERRGLSWVEEISGVQRAVAEKFVNAYVQTIRPGAGNSGDDASGRLFLIGRGGAREGGKFLDCLHAPGSGHHAAPRRRRDDNYSAVGGRQRWSTADRNRDCRGPRPLRMLAGSG